jgi:hypothetical protein
MGVPAEVTPVAPGGEQKDPAWTMVWLGATGVGAVAGGDVGEGLTGGGTEVGLASTGGPPVGRGCAGQVDRMLAMAVRSAGVTHSWYLILTATWVAT